MEFWHKLATDPEYFGRYTLWENVFLLLGVVFWAYMYAVLMIEPFKKKFVEMPVFIACGNIIWEFLWGFVFQEPMGVILLWGYRLGFFLDIFIFYHVIRFGKKQISLPISDGGYRLLLLVLVVSWGALIYTFHQGGYDLFTGSNSAYILSVIISGLYPILFLKMSDARLFSYPVAWAKFLGNLFFTIFIFLYFPEQHFVQTLGAIGTVADVYYVWIFKRRK
ncbi:hypothetical protein EHQ27_00920 [Leptospira wolffii]|uniref:transmembrane-type terpene cyclase n=1 Tax=Leptospira wolffii TaxID=409998 RepID=UPI0003449559|nr:hypothetical protein [Leptospira wolffii]TGK59346.1 hypothetical protein EHQ32_11190 [Leptospira wolffii]TGK71271.1 hypothetical protein EHQ35_14155 [Leptospira wolffii]TGK77838.1 hypothetical protein EHQ27_00920 [Leptospira wolffii]TGL29452.1 hypothetical protein EHQ57_11000 [Leptospira wolffii]